MCLLAHLIQNAVALRLYQSHTDITAFFLLYNLKMPFFFLYMKLHRQAVTTLAELITYPIMSKHFLIIKSLDKNCSFLIWLG